MKKILIVEDDPISSMSMKLELENAGYEICDIVNSGETTLKAVKRNEPDLILMDISLSGEMDGIITAQTLNEEYEIPIIYLTGNSDIHLFDRAKHTTPYGYIVKPVKTGELIKNISMSLINSDLKKQLKENEKKFRDLTENSGDIIFKIINDTVEYCSPSVERLLGYRTDELMGISRADLTVKLSIDNFGKSGNDNDIYEIKVMDKKGKVKYFEINLSVNTVHGESGFSEIQGSARDVTRKIILQEQKNLMNDILQMLNSSGMKHGTITDVVEKIREFLSVESVVLRIKDGDYFPQHTSIGYEYSMHNESELEKLRISPETLAGKVIYGKLNDDVKSVTSSGSFFCNDFRKFAEEDSNLLTVDHEDLDHIKSLAYIPLRTENKLVGFLMISDPKTGKLDCEIVNFIEGIAGSIASAVVRKQISDKLEKSLIEKEHLLEKERILVEKERQLQNRIFETIQDERKKIGQDLHDGLGQNLTAIAFLSQAMYKKLSTENYLDPKYIEKINSIIEKSIIQTKMLSRLLYPIELEDYNFIDAIVNMAANVSKLFEVNCKVIYHDKIPDLPKDITTNLYYITSEAVTNAIKHGNSKNIDIIIDAVDNVLNINVSDDGTGMSVNTETANGFGIKSMKYRAQVINAKFSAENNTDKGFSIALKMEI